MRAGRYEVLALTDTAFGLDGGAMFGVVPRPLWEREQPPDEANRIRLASRCLLLRGGGRTVLVDTGLGDRWTARERERYAIERPGGLVAELGVLGVSPDEVTDVIQTHLHFDHAGGLTRWDGDGGGGDAPVVATFPSATLHVQRRNWEWAHAPTPRDAGSYRPADWAIYEDLPGRLHLVDGAATVLDGIEAIPTDGHTPGQQMLRVAGSAGEPDLVFCGDVVPTRSHLRLPWTMAYDLQPLVILDEKRRLLREAARGGTWLALEHDAGTACVRVEEDGRGGARPVATRRLDGSGSLEAP